MSDRRHKYSETVPKILLILLLHSGQTDQTCNQDKFSLRSGGVSLTIFKCSSAALSANLLRESFRHILPDKFQ